MNRQHRLKLVRRHAANREHAGLRGFDEEHRLVVRARGDRERQHAFVNVGRNLLAARAEADLDLRRVGELEALRRTGVFERKILDVNLLDR